MRCPNCNQWYLRGKQPYHCVVCFARMPMPTKFVGFDPTIVVLAAIALAGLVCLFVFGTGPNP